MDAGFNPGRLPRRGSRLKLTLMQPQGPVNFGTIGSAGDAQFRVQVSIIDGSGDGRDSRSPTYVYPHSVPPGPPAQLDSASFWIENGHEDGPNGDDSSLLTGSSLLIPRGIAAQVLKEAIDARLAEEVQAQRWSALAPRWEEIQVTPAPAAQPPAQEGAAEEVMPSSGGSGSVPGLAPVLDGPRPHRRNLLMEAMNSKENQERLKVRMAQLERIRARKEEHLRHQLLQIHMLTPATEPMPEFTLPTRRNYATPAPNFRAAAPAHTSQVPDLVARAPGPTPSAPNLTVSASSSSAKASAPDSGISAWRQKLMAEAKPPCRFPPGFFPCNVGPVWRPPEPDAGDLSTSMLPSGSPAQFELSATARNVYLPGTDTASGTPKPHVRPPPGFPADYLKTSGPVWCPPGSNTRKFPNNSLDVTRANTDTRRNGYLNWPFEGSGGESGAFTTDPNPGSFLSDQDFGSVRYQRWSNANSP